MVPRKKEKPKQDSQTEELQKEKDELLTKLQRVAADYDNYQKRAAKQIAEGIAHEKERIIKAMLPVLDDFERAIGNAEGTEDVELLAKGVKIVYEHMLAALKAQGVEHIAAASEQFDPSMHEAMLRQADADKEDGVILEELQKGYKLNGRVIRASRVIVNKLPEAEAAQEPETTDTQ